MQFYYLSHALPKRNWKTPHVSMFLGASENQEGRIPSHFINKTILPNDKIISYFLTGKRNQSWDLISDVTVRSPYQNFISQKFYGVLMEHKLPECSFGNLSVYDQNFANPLPYKLMNLERREDLSIVDFTRSKFQKYDDALYRNVPVEVEGQAEFVAKRPEFDNIVFKEDRVPDLDLFILQRFSAWIISATLAQRLIEEKITGLFGFPFSPEAKVSIHDFRRENDNFFDSPNS